MSQSNPYLSVTLKHVLIFSQKSPLRSGSDGPRGVTPRTQPSSLDSSRDGFNLRCHRWLNVPCVSQLVAGGNQLSGGVGGDIMRLGNMARGLVVFLFIGRASSVSYPIYVAVIKCNTLLPMS